MSNVRSGFKLGLQTVLIAGVLLLSSGHSWAQTVQPESREFSSGDPFATYHNALSSAADSLLAASAERSVGKPSNKPTARLEPRPEPENAAAASGRDERSGLKQAISRVQQLRSVLEPILRNEGVPAALAAVVFVESRGQATALSPKGARGLWQFMPDTARRYGLVVTASLDERLDPYKSTRAAARYLRDLYAQFGNWPLALAAYNAGEDAVERAIERAASRDFNSIARAGMLPLETRNYVPAVLSAIGMMKETAGRYLTTGAGKSAIAAVVYAADGAGKTEVYE